MPPTWSLTGVKKFALRGHVEAICKVKKKNAIFIKLSGNDLLST